MLVFVYIVRHLGNQVGGAIAKHVYQLQFFAYLLSVTAVLFLFYQNVICTLVPKLLYRLSFTAQQLNGDEQINMILFVDT